MKALIEIRSQHSRGSSASKFGGPDRYIAVQLVPDGQVPLNYLNHTNAAKRGITIHWCGEYYSRNTGPRSAYARAVAVAEAYVRAACGRAAKDGKICEMT